MTREEEIKKEAVFCYPEMTSRHIAFINGAKFADRTMLKKVCGFFEPRLIALIGREDAEELLKSL